MMFHKTEKILDEIKMGKYRPKYDNINTNTKLGKFVVQKTEGNKLYFQILFIINDTNKDNTSIRI